MTALLILHPVRFPEHGLYTCYDGLVEINTVILTFKRTVRFQHRGAKALVTFLHWSTFIALRMIAYPIFTKVRRAQRTKCAFARPCVERRRCCPVRPRSAHKSEGW